MGLSVYVLGTACYQNVLKRYHMSFEHIAMIVWIRKTWLHLIWINLMVTIFIISCYAFAGGSWVSRRVCALESGGIMRAKGVGWWSWCVTR